MTVKVGYIQYDVRRDRELNYEVVRRYLERSEFEIAVLPELSFCGYLFKSKHELLRAAEPVPGGVSTERMREFSKRYGCAIIFGVAELDGEDVYNTAVVVSGGKYVGKYRKIHLSTLEKQLFKRGTDNCIFYVGGIKVGVQICFDLWFPEISREQITMGAELLCVLANFGGETTYIISQTRAIENLTPLVLCNRIGSERIAGIDADFLGRSTIIDKSGKRSSVAGEGRELSCVCEVSPAGERSNVICGDFMAEISLHICCCKK